MNYIKLLNYDLKHFNFTYKKGLNIDHNPFNPKGSCEKGGLYFTTKEHMFHYPLRNYKYIANVEIPNDAKVYNKPDGNKWKADKLILDDIRLIKDLEIWKEKEFWKRNSDPYLLHYCPFEKDLPEHYLNVVKRYPRNIMTVPGEYITNEMRILAIRHFGSGNIVKNAYMWNKIFGTKNDF